MRWSVEELIYGLKIASNREYKLKYRIINFPAAIWRMVKVFFKWLFTGYCWATIWSLDYYFMEVIIQRLKMFKKMNKNGYPANFKNEEEWEKIIDRLIHGFEVMKSEEYGLDYEQVEPTFEPSKDFKDCITMTIDRTPEQEAEMRAAWKKQEDYDEETMDLFIKYFRNLWD